ncbi:MAG: hypothetical protein QF752_16535 [Planctomycetota bacterium]|jgi:hypothetical protein|nr:hypothetical protein [Planctomycetota bacterium]
MSRLRLLIFHLSLAVWLGSTGFLFLSAGSVFTSVAPYKGQHPELAAKVVGGIFDSYIWVLLLAGIPNLASLFWPGPGRHHFPRRIIVALLITTLLIGFWQIAMRPHVVEAGIAMRNAPEGPEGAPIRKRFGQLHGLTFVSALLALILQGYSLGQSITLLESGNGPQPT